MTIANDQNDCPKCGRSDCSHTWEINTPAAPERGDQPKLIDQLLDAAIYTADIDRRVAARVRIVKMFDQYSILIAQRERLLEVLRVIRDSFWSENEPHSERVIQLQQMAAEAITTSEQEGGIRR